MFEPFPLVIDAFAGPARAKLPGDVRQERSRPCAHHPCDRRLALERIAGTDALYHDALHTLFVADVGQAILRGRAMTEAVSPDDWLHFTAATLLHDIGYLRGICPGDSPRALCHRCGRGHGAGTRGATDAFLAPWHVERGKIFVRHRCAGLPFLDVERVCRAIELTRFPVPEDGDYAETDSEPGLVRAADLIGQLADPAYPRKQVALCYEFCEIGVTERLGCKDPADLADEYPRFFWSGWNPMSGRHYAILSGRQRDGCGWRSFMLTSLSRSTRGIGWDRSGGRAARTGPRPVRRHRDGCAPPRAPSAGRAWS